MQPYFFPYIGYFSLMNHVDEFVLLDEVQYIRHGWIERNRVIKQQGGWMYISVPLKKHSQKSLIKDICIDYTIDWRKRILDQLVVYRKLAPNYFRVRKFLEGALSHNIVGISDLNFQLLNEIRLYLEIDCKISQFDSVNLIRSKIDEPDDWALEICKTYSEPVTYYNPEGGKAFFDKQKYEDSGIPIYFFKQNLLEYSQGENRQFESGLSILDVMMFNTVPEIKKMLQNFDLI